jgi:hypothetical protein
MAHIKRLLPSFAVMILLLIGALLLSSKIALADDPIPTTRLHEAQVTQIARTFCRKIGQSITIPGTAAFTETPKINPGSYWQSRWQVDFPGQARVEVVDATGIVAHYANESYSTIHQNESDPPGEALTQADAIQRAKKAIDATGQSEPIKFMNAQLAQFHDPPLASCYSWIVSWYRTSHDIPYRDQHVSLIMDAQTGEIQNLVLMFPTPPLVSAVQNFGQDDAMNAAASIIINQGIEESAYHTDTHLEIIQAGPDKKMIRLAWISSFVVDGHWRQVYLDAETGDVLGGGRASGPAGRGPAAVKAPAPLPLAQALRTVHNVYLRRIGTSANGSVKPFLKFGLDNQPHEVGVLRKTADFRTTAPAETAPQELVLVSKSGAIGVYSYYPQTGLLGNGSDWATVPGEFKAWIQRKSAAGAGKK